VVAKLGSLAVIASKDGDGRIEIGGGARPDGDANLRVSLRGPKGQAEVHVDAQLTNGAWSMAPVDFQSSVR